MQMKCQQKKQHSACHFKIQVAERLTRLLHVNQLWTPRGNDKLARDHYDTTDAEG
jgi:hypothetical protein